MNIACALRWGVASVGITLLDVAHPIREKHFRCRIYTGEQLSFGTVRLKKPTCGFYNSFCKIFGTNYFWHVPLCKRVVIELIWTVFIIVLYECG